MRRRTRSSPLAQYDRCVGTAKHGRRSRLLFNYDCKQFVPHFFLCSCTCLILGLGPQTTPPSMTTHHGLVTSHCITLTLKGQNHQASR